MATLKQVKIMSDIKLEVFCDEIKGAQNSETGEIWDYICIVGIPIEKKQELLNKLQTIRNMHKCESEIKSIDLDHSPKRKTAEGWLDIVLQDQLEKKIYFSILGINRSKLNFSSFGGNNFSPIYNRFFRPTLLGLLKYSFAEYNKVIVKTIYHDKGELEDDEIFPWHVIDKISLSEHKIFFDCKNITFIDSDHRNPQGQHESHIIQLSDLLVGLTSECLDYTSHKPAKTLLGKKFYPLLERMINHPKNTRSSFGHYRKYLISFFPSEKLTLEEIQNHFRRAQSGFTTGRSMSLSEKATGQLNLFIKTSKND